MTAQQDLARIASVLAEANVVARRFTPETVRVHDKGIAGPVTEADYALDALLRTRLKEPGDGWLSEESADESDRSALRRVWIVDPLDGTHEFLANVPEWAVSVALVEEGTPVAGGVLNPSTGLLAVGSRASGVTYGERRVGVRDPGRLEGLRLAASRTEVKAGRWKGFGNRGFTITPTGSIAYKLALVAVGKMDAVVSLSPKNEWDVAGGTALVEAGGGRVIDLEGKSLRFNRRETRVHGIIAGGVHTVGLLQTVFSVADLEQV